MVEKLWIARCELGFWELADLSVGNWFWLVRKSCEWFVNVDFVAGFIGDCKKWVL